LHISHFALTLPVVGFLAAAYLRSRYMHVIHASMDTEIPARATISRYVKLPVQIDARVGELVRRGEFLSVSEALRQFAVQALARRDFERAE
jgi:hypothetical protein